MESHFLVDTTWTNGFDGLILPIDRRVFNAGDPAVAKLLTFIAAVPLRRDAIVLLTAKRDLFIPLAGVSDARDVGVPATVRFTTLVRVRFTDGNLVVVAGRPKLDPEELERDNAADSDLSAMGSLRPRVPDGTGVTTRAAERMWNILLRFIVKWNLDVVSNTVYYIGRTLSGDIACG